MNEKKEKIIKTGIHLFAKKGFSSTTIQEIAGECGISKGAFYLHFKSKEDLLLSACEYYIGMSMEEIKKIKTEHQHKPPKDVFQKQIAYQFREFMEHKDFIILLLSEKVIPENQKVKQYFHEVNIQFNMLYRDALLSVYGDAVTPFLADASVMAQGIVSSYIHFLIFNEHTAFQTENVAAFLIARIDDLITGLIKDNPDPLLSEDIFTQPAADREKLLADIQMAKAQQGLPEDVLVSLEVIEEECQKEEPRKPIIKGMLSNLAGSGNEQIETLRASIETHFSLTI
ncbi:MULTISPECIES: TetR/AcrR family transcriptional regulator [Bacillus]|jgi:AcrR family transcriptional regulator|uniref:Transcriptional regulator (TetR/AcrR family) n=1 Tax=Bacillus amyloliquefaciens (strain ATCC 23350 / DSM 7 / BCRC 11601 / CCUG 28519 / NBRC 15535 / NRRL B-14393 / F) TaxID=692420 RepID=A0A9P1JEM1_BACAS|nr:TetR/AcrR family transcriptional regulator [Bacillus amyloliquefaciens]AIW32704.1 TetR family transcriptional regulator [Bacillus subtilis]AEB22813.1 transcriptional regulator (TetR/AcrR family) protein [Bacillus amyloliquefaciens TA208]AEB62261.1 putative transcriptional regulator (TetR/AcrR family) [Bacillus amyloliquefaciens LL3]AEK87803.1 putative transcriptional regulator (TetR/AcrR family) [Bacillus amyloliquefaciens XH7]ARW37881.1 putative HTH-type transcriptional regulator YerO [Bac